MKVRLTNTDTKKSLEVEISILSLDEVRHWASVFAGSGPITVEEVPTAEFVRKEGQP